VNKKFCLYVYSSFITLLMCLVRLSSFEKNKDYFRLDGRTKSAVRQDHIDKFNDRKSPARLFLVSTKVLALVLLFKEITGYNVCQQYNPTQFLETVQFSL
jgi:hypothetical protein